MLKRILGYALLLGVCGFPLTARADQYAVQADDGQTKIAHTRLAPVIMHRVFPPFWGLHVYRRPGARD